MQSHSIAKYFLLPILICAPSQQVIAQGIPATTNPTFNAAIINGSATMVWERGKATGSGLICGRTYSDDNEKALLLARQAKGLCGNPTNPRRINATTFNNNLLKTAVKPLGSISGLNFISSVAIRRNNYARLVEEIRITDPAAAQKLERLFATTDVVDRIGKAMATKGLKPNNVADAYAIYWTNAWLNLNDRREDLPDKQMMAVRTQSANALLATPQFRSLTNAQKQEIAESMLVRVVLISAAIDSAKSDPSQLANVKIAIAKGAKEFGLDLDRMTLTSQGFRPIDSN